MNDLLIFFAFPVAVIILSAIFQTIIHSPIKIAGITFAIFLVITFAFFDETFLIATIIYTILAYLTALLVCFIHRVIRQNNTNDNEATASTFSMLNQTQDNQSTMSNTDNSLDSIVNNENIKYYNYRRYR